MKALFLIALPFLFLSSASAGTITLATHDLFPYGYFNATNEFTGYAVERVRHAVGRCGFSLNLLVVPWARAQALAKSGSVDGFFAGSLNDERKALYVPSDVLAPQKWTWYLRKDAAIGPEDPAFRTKARVGSFIGANMLRYLEENGYNTSEAPKDTEALFQMLMLDRFDAILANNLVAGKVIEDHRLQDSIRAVDLKNEPLHALFTKKFIAANPGFLERFNAAIAEYDQSPQSRP